MTIDLQSHPLNNKLEKPLLGREALDTRFDLAYGTRTNERAHALLNTTLSTAETNELSGPCYLSLPANVTVYHHRKHLTLRVFRAVLAIYSCANFSNDKCTLKVLGLISAVTSAFRSCEPFSLNDEERI